MTAPRAVLPEPWTVGAYAIQITDLGRHKDYDYTQFTLRKIGDEASWYVERFRIITVHEDEPRRTDRMAVCETCRDKLSLAHPQARR